MLILVRSALDPRLWVVKVRQDRADRDVGEVGLDVTVQEQQRRVRHENGEGEIKGEMTCALQTT